MNYTEKVVPLIERLRQVPSDARLIVEEDYFSSSSHPVGPLAHEAAAEIERLREALKRQAAAALTGMDAATSIAKQDVERAKKFYAESAPDALESERAANSLLTAELEQVETERDMLKVDNERLREALTELVEIVEDAIAQKSAKDLDSFTLQPARAALVAEREREACAKTCDQLSWRLSDDITRAAFTMAADSIRARTPEL